MAERRSTRDASVLQGVVVEHCPKLGRAGQGNGSALYLPAHRGRLWLPRPVQRDHEQSHRAINSALGSVA
jgi:hypothetical protein